DGAHDDDVAAYLARYSLDGIDRMTGKHVTARFRDFRALEHTRKPFASLGFRGLRRWGQPWISRAEVRLRPRRRVGVRVARDLRGDGRDRRHDSGRDGR